MQINPMDYSYITQGSEHHNAKLTEEKVEEILHRYKNGMRIKDLAACYNVTDATIRAAVNGQTWKKIYKKVHG